MKNQLFFLLILLILLGCNSKENAINVSEWKPLKQIQFPVDENVNPYAIKIEVFINKGGKQQVYFLDGNNQILVYDIDSQSLHKKIILEKEGNNGVGLANGFKLLSTDSILITSKFFQKLFLVNSNGIVINTFPFDTDVFTVSRTCSNVMQPLIIKGNVWVLPQSLLGNWNTIDKAYFDEYTTTVDYNPTNRALVKSGLKLPFQSSHINSTNFSYTFFNNNLVYSFAASDSLYAIDKNKVKRYNAKSANIKVLIDMAGKSSSSAESSLRNKIGSGEYSILLPDVFRKVIYRFYKIGTKNIASETNLIEMNSFPPAFGIQVINEKFKVIADVVFPENKYFFSNSFVTEDGLYISINHPLNPDFDVNYFAFDQFVFHK